MSDEQLYRIDITERTDTKVDGDWKVTHTWECSQPVLYEGVWEAGIYMWPPSISWAPVTHSVVGESEAACRVLASEFVRRQSEISRSVADAFVEQLRGGIHGGVDR